MSNPKDRLRLIHRKIRYIQEICQEDGSVTRALADAKRSRASILMHLTSISEQFSRLSEDAEFEILAHFDKEDLRGSQDVRNYIAHDYEGVNLAIIESIIRTKLPKIKKVIEEILSVDSESDDP